jgi:hypothetical protein
MFMAATGAGQRALNRRHVIDLIPPAAICAEIGVWKADFSHQVAALAKPREFHLIDPWAFVPAFSKRWYGGAAARSQADMDTIHQGVVVRMTEFPGIVIHRQSSLAAAASVPDRTFDWVYVDGDHSFAAVKADLEAWWPKMKSGGFLVADDYNWKDEAGRRSVKLAIEAFVAEHRLAGPVIKDGQCILRVP